MEQDDKSHDQSRGDWIRELIKKHPRWENKKIAEELSKNGIDVSSTYVRQVRHRLKSKSKGKSGKGRRGGHQPRPFPANPLKDAIQIPKVIKEYNGGNAWPPQVVAKAIDMGGSTNAFYDLTASSRDYGLTIGTRDTDTIELTP